MSKQSQGAEWGENYFLASPNQTDGTWTTPTGYRFLKKDELICFLNWLADKWVTNAAMPLLRRYNAEFYMISGPVYKPLDKNEFCYYARQYAHDVHKIILNAPQCLQLLDSCLIRTCESSKSPDDESYTVFRNGLVSNMDGTVIMPPADYFATICVAADYLVDEVLYHPTTDAFLYSITGGDSELIERHWEFWGYVLSSDYHAKALFSLYGASGNNGKSTELTLLSHLLPNAVDCMSLGTLTGRFGPHRLQHCRLEYSADEGNLNLSSAQIGFLKSASGMDTITADVKSREMVRFTCKCKIAIASNYDIGMAYTTTDQAFARRVVTIPYPYSIPPEQQDPYILQKILEERNAIATEAFRHYLNLRKRGYRFTGAERFDKLQQFVSYPINPEYNAIREFSERFCDFTDAEAFTPTQELYRVFDANFKTSIIDITGFSQAFYHLNQERLEKTRKRVSSDNLRGFFGVKLLIQ